MRSVLPDAGISPACCGVHVTEIVYTIKHTPEGKWMLETDKASYGPFTSRAEAEGGMQRLRVPEIYTFDKNGELT